MSKRARASESPEEQSRGPRAPGSATPPRVGLSKPSEVMPWLGKVLLNLKPEKSPGYLVGAGVRSLTVVSWEGRPIVSKDLSGTFSTCDM
jgi:hypothetical protein